MTELLKIDPRPVVHVVDDDDAVRDGLANLLRSADLEVATYASPELFMSRWRPTHRGCLVLDIRFPNTCGLEFQAQFCAAMMALPIILITGHADVPSSVRGMKAGAVDYLAKPFEDEALLDAVRVAFARDAARHRHDQELLDIVMRYETLTVREKEVMALVASGLMNKQAAGELGLSEITVKVHRGSMMRKMNMRTLADLVRAAEALKARAIQTRQP
jgi:FixJ family two-component response regulator